MSIRAPRAKASPRPAFSGGRASETGAVRGTHVAAVATLAFRVGRRVRIPFAPAASHVRTRHHGFENRRPLTQQFNTTSSMGRLTLNVLLSFAQFEREVTGERIRDKIAASKKKGMWMGGNAPLGYDANERTLVTNPAEAEIVRRIFAFYRELGCVRRVKEEADGLGLRTKCRTSADGTEQGGKPFSRGHLYPPGHAAIRPSSTPAEACHRNSSSTIILDRERGVRNRSSDPVCSHS